MDKKELKIKLEALEANVEVRRDELGFAMSAAQIAREEIANLGKPVITEDVANQIVSKVCEAFQEVLCTLNVPDSIEIDFSMDYDNRVVVDGISGFDEVDVDEDSIMEILIDTFNIDHSNGEDGNDTY
jgi:hypothetical protein